MPRLVGEAHHLVFDGGAVPRAHAVDFPGKHGGPGEVCPDDVVGGFVRVGEPAVPLVPVRVVVHEGEGMVVRVAFFHLHVVGMEGAHVHAARRAGLEPEELDAVLPEVVRQDEARAHAAGAAAVDGLADDDLAVQVRPRGEDDRRRAVFFAELGHDARGASVLHEDVRHHELFQVEIVRIFHAALHPPVVGVFVRLGAERVHRGALAAVQHAHLDGRGVRGDAHDAAERVDLPHEMALARAADGGVAGHHGHIVQRNRGKERLRSEFRRGERRLASRVPRADDDHVIAVDEIHTVPSFLSGSQSPCIIEETLRIFHKSGIIRKKEKGASHDPTHCHRSPLPRAPFRAGEEIGQKDRP